jgi:hypothetical protein
LFVHNLANQPVTIERLAFLDLETVMIKRVKWGVAYALSWIGHILWPVPLFYFNQEALGIERMPIQVAVIFGIWIALVIVFRGCPFGYLHQWIEIRAGWRTEKTYTFEHSVFYRFVLRPTRTVIGWL